MRMRDPAHPDEIASGNLEAEGWIVNERAACVFHLKVTTDFT